MQMSNNLVEYVRFGAWVLARKKTAAGRNNAKQVKASPRTKVSDMAVTCIMKKHQKGRRTQQGLN